MIRIAVIDTGFDIDHPMVGALYSVKLRVCDEGKSKFNFTDEHTDNVKDEHGHGTHVAGLIAKNVGLAPVCIIPLKYYTQKGMDSENLTRSIASINKAIEFNADIINYSGGGIAPSGEECDAVKRALDKGIVVVAAAGNEGDDLAVHKYWPAMCDPRVVMASSQDTWTCPDRKCGPNYSTDPKIKLKNEAGKDQLSILPGGQYGYMTGTSQSTAILTGKLAAHLYILRKSEYGRYLIKKASGWGK